MTEHDNGTNVLVRFHEIVRRTDKAVLISIEEDDDDTFVWIPESQIAMIDTGLGEVWIPLWLAEEEGLEYD